MLHLDALYRFAMYLTSNDTEAQDLTQDTLHHALRAYKSFKKGTNARAWLFRIARNLRIDRVRRRSRERDYLARQEGLAGLGGADTFSEARLAEGKSLLIDGEEVFIDLFGDEVMRYLDELPQDFRTTLLLCDIEGLTYREISDVAGCPIGTVRSRISRAREHLRARLYEYARELGFVRSSPVEGGSRPSPLERCPDAEN